MGVREHLRRAVEGVPEGGAITLPVAAVRAWLREDRAERGDLPAGQRSYTTSEAAEVAGVRPSTVAEWAKVGRLEGAWKTGEDGGGEWRIPEGALLDLMQARKDEGDRIRFE